MKIQTANDMKQLGAHLAAQIRGGQCIELVGDVGAGKTTFVQGIGQGLGIKEAIQSPSFTISREYTSPNGTRLAHYDFYRLQDAGVMSYELAESLSDVDTITIVEWAETINAVLPKDKIRIVITNEPDSEARIVDIDGATV